MNHELKQVDVRLKLVVKRESSVWSRSTHRQKLFLSGSRSLQSLTGRRSVWSIWMERIHPINFNIVSIGSLNASLVTGREVYKSAVLSNAARVIMLHNHRGKGMLTS